MENEKLIEGLRIALAYMKDRLRSLENKRSEYEGTETTPGQRRRYCLESGLAKAGWSREDIRAFQKWALEHGDLIVQNVKANLPENVKADKLLDFVHHTDEYGCPAVSTKTCKDGTGRLWFGLDGITRPARTSSGSIKTSPAEVKLVGLENQKNQNQKNQKNQKK